MVRRTLITILAMLAATGVAVGPASAQRSDHGKFQRGDDRNIFEFQRGDRGGLGSQWAPQEDREQREVPLSSVLRDLRAQFGGKHLDAQKVGNRYVIAWITGDGRRLTIEVDAATGRIISTR